VATTRRMAVRGRGAHPLVCRKQRRLDEAFDIHGEVLDGDRKGEGDEKGGVWWEALPRARETLAHVLEPAEHDAQRARCRLVRVDHHEGLAVGGDVEVGAEARQIAPGERE